MQCDSNVLPNVQRWREGSFYDTMVVAPTAAIPANSVLFAGRSGDTVGKHICNLPQMGELGDGESHVVEYIGFEFCGTSIADITQAQKFLHFSLEVAGQRVVKEQPLSNFPFWSGAFGIEGANGGSAMGAQGWYAVRPLRDPIVILGKQQIRATLALGVGAAPAVIAATGFFSRLHLYGQDRTNG